MKPKRFPIFLATFIAILALGYFSILLPALQRAGSYTRQCDKLSEVWSGSATGHVERFPRRPIAFSLAAFGTETGAVEIAERSFSGSIIVRQRNKIVSTWRFEATNSGVTRVRFANDDRWCDAFPLQFEHALWRSELAPGKPFEFELQLASVPSTNLALLFDYYRKVGAR